MGDTSLQSFLSDDEGFEILETSPSMDCLRYDETTLKTDTVDNIPTVNGDVRPSITNSMNDPMFKSVVPPVINNSFMRGAMEGSDIFSTMSSVPSSVYQGEIQEKLSILFQENKELKETLQKNNMAMRQQFSTLMTWQEDVRKVQQNYKQKLVETKELVTKLRTENSDLKRNKSLDYDLLNENDHLRKKIETLQNNVQQSPPNSYDKDIKPKFEKLSQELQNVQQSCIESTIECERVKAQLSQTTEHVENITKEKTELEEELMKANNENKMLHERKQDSDEKLTSLKGVLSKMTAKCHQQETLIVDLKAEEQLRREELRAVQSQLADLQAEKNAFEVVNNSMMSTSSAASSQAFDTVIQLREELQTVKDQLINAQAEKVTLSFKSYEPAESTIADTTHSINRKVNLYEIYLNQVVDVYNQQSKRQAYLQHNLEGTLASLNLTDPVRAELIPLKELADKHQQEIVSDREKLILVQTQFQNIFEEFRNLASELQEIKNSSEASNIATKNMLLEQQKQFSEKIDELHAQLLDKDELISEKELDRVKVMEELVVVKQQNESIDILKAQLDLYKSDFDQERSQRQNIAIEREQIAEDLRLLQRRNEQLIKEVQEARSSEGAAGPSPAPTDQTSNTPARTSVSPEAAFRFSCPMCYSQFRSYHILQEHVENCGDLI